MYVGILKPYRQWSFLTVEHELGRLYRQLFLRTYGIKLERPSNSEHITVIAPQDNFDCSVLTPIELKFSLLSSLWHNGNAVWLDVVSPDIIQFRRSLGLTLPDVGLHFCIGYTDGI
jgi:hypothetical protein